MEIVRIQGPSYLEGIINVQGSKNAALPMLAASVLNGGNTVLYNCPRISDINASVSILRYLGCTAQRRDNMLVINSSGAVNANIPDAMMSRLRSSFLFSGALLARCGKVSVTYPGGCNIGTRPVDIHLDAFRRLGVSVNTDGSNIYCTADKLKPCDITLRFPSVGATENIMLLSTAAKGTTRIYGAACEPEIADLQNLLCSMGADITGAGTPVITIHGGKTLKDTKYKIMPDRVAAATYITAAACAGGELELNGVNPHHISPFIAAMRKCGLDIHIYNDVLNAVKKSRLCGGINIRTLPYPGFATDMQSLMMAALVFSDGVSTIQENIFENRFCLAETLSLMGADINVFGRTASIRGVRQTKGINAKACDLRSGAALALAMLASQGCSELGGIHYIDRGYENFIQRLTSVGARMERIEKVEGKR